jgi:microcystin-dependent protein
MVAAFRLPECPRGWTAYALAQGRTIIGVGEGAGLTRRTLEETGGAETHTLTVSEIPAHNHVANPYIYALRVTGSYTAKSIDNTPGEPNLASKGEIRSAGGGQPHNIMQPFVALLYCEKN